METDDPLPDLGALRGMSLVHPDQLDRDMIIGLCRAAALIEAGGRPLGRPLAGSIAITAFFEASTRTRLSFESAVVRLGGGVLSVPDGKVTGVAKGESLADIGEMFTGYGDVVIVRHPDQGSVEEIGASAGIPVINAGNGTAHHPTQALADWYALLKWRPALALEDCAEDERIHLVVMGSPSTMRAVNSFLWLSSRFGSAIQRITVASVFADPFEDDLRAELESAGIDVELTDDPASVVGDADVLYMNAIVPVTDGFVTQDDAVTVSASIGLKPQAVVMHPLARGPELDEDLDDTEHNLYFAQAAGAVHVREALLLGILGDREALAVACAPAQRDET